MSDTILVYPRLGRLTSKWRQEQATAAELVQKRKTRRGVFEDEFHRIREYRWDDNPRAIHWRTSARRNELMVREFHQSRDQDLIVLLDLWLPSRPTGADFDRVELAVSFAATVCIDFLKLSRESELCLLTCGKSVTRWRGPAGGAAIEPVLERLAVVESGISPDVEQLFDRWLAERSTVTRTVLVTTRHRDERGFAELIGSSSETNRPTSDVQVFEASQRELQPYFQLD